MKEDKYYTPSIEEFHVGFEYETGDPSESNWFEMKADGDFDINGDVRIYVPTGQSIRVKYLDKEDIKSLGFIQTRDTSECQCFQLLLDDTSIFYELELYEENEVWIERFSQSGVDNNRIDYNSEYVFKGKIKNKSELKKILQQIGIRIKSNKE